MSEINTAYKYIDVDRDGVATIYGTTMKVVELVTAQKAYGWSPEEIHFQHPYLTMSQIHSALAYYWDCQAEMDADIQRRFDYAQSLRDRAKGSRQ
jgi:uncharacterized protein (DUF433 family)